MELAFHSQSVRSICESERQAKLVLGDRVADTLKHRLADLRAATSVKDLLVGQPRVRDGAHGQEMVLDLCDGHYMAFAANHAKNPTTQRGDVDWERVSRIKILRVGGGHG